MPDPTKELLAETLRSVNGNEHLYKAVRNELRIAVEDFLLDKYGEIDCDVREALLDEIGIHFS